MSDGHTERLEGALDGKYRIERKLGEGGMASVYLAEDLKHQRRVALKILKPELAAVIGADRFLSEIRTTANLQHPHILALFDSGEASGYLYYVMPYIDGETLREKLDREKQLGVEESVRIARDVADALDYAHRHGVIHRDIKPGNILLHDGRPVVADFGIALAVSAAGGGRMTETGLSLGTPHYMSPEQASADRDLSARSDVYSLGCVLYEMIGGQPPHSGPSAQSVLVHILTKEAAPLTELRHTVPPHVASTVAKAIEKLPADRFDTARAFMDALEDEGFVYAPARVSATSTGVAPASVAVATSVPWYRDRRVVAALLVAAVASAVAVRGSLTPRPDVLPVFATRLPIELGGIELGLYEEIAVSPDGSRFAVTGILDGDRALYWRSADEESFRVVPGTNGAQGTTFSPDGEWLVYTTTSGGVYKVSLLGGAPVTLVRAGSESLGAYGPHWGDDGTIVFKNPSGSFQVSDTGGDYARIPGFEAVIHTHLLPGGRGVLGSRIPGGIMFADFEADTVRELTAPGVGHRPKYVETGHILYVDVTGGLWALPFDASSGDVLGDAVPIFDGVTVTQLAGFSFPRYSVSRNGTLAYGAGGGGSGGERRLVVLDLEGNEVTTALGPRDIGSVRWSPDGQSVVYESVAEADLDRDIYTYAVELGTTPRRLTFEGENTDPVYSPDGTRVAFSAFRPDTESLDVFVKTLTDDTPARPVAAFPRSQWVTDWFSDDLIAIEQSPNPSDLWVLDVSDPTNPSLEAYMSAEADLDDMVVSPDGTLAAYVSDETGRNNVYVRNFPVPGERTQVSQDGGAVPRWSPDGATLYYWARTARTASTATLWAASLRTSPNAVLSRVPLFASELHQPTVAWDLHPDGDRLVFAADVGAGTGQSLEPERFVVVTNWLEELRQRVGSN